MLPRCHPPTRIKVNLFILTTFSDHDQTWVVKGNDPHSAQKNNRYQDQKSEETQFILNDNGDKKILSGLED